MAVLCLFFLKQIKWNVGFLTETTIGAVAADAANGADVICLLLHLLLLLLQLALATGGR